MLIARKGDTATLGPKGRQPPSRKTYWQKRARYDIMIK